MPRLFLAVWPPPAVLDELWELDRPDRDGVRWVPRHDLHVTLRFLGDAEVGEVMAALDGISFPGGTARVGPEVQQLGRHVVVAPVSGLDDLATMVTATTVDVGRPPDDRGFKGHITLARLNDGDARRHPPLVGTPLDLDFRVREVALVLSETRSTGAVYRTVHRWPTAG